MTRDQKAADDLADEATAAGEQLKALRRSLLEKRPAVRRAGLIYEMRLMDNLRVLAMLAKKLIELAEEGVGEKWPTT